MRDAVATLLRRLSPRHRNWQRLLDSCAVDPDRLARPLEDLGGSDFLICGHSRSGSALLTAALWQPPRLVTVMEPWDCFRLVPADLVRSLRREIESSGTLSRGRLDIAAIAADRRVRWCRDGEKPVTVRVEDGYFLGVKMPAFWRYLDLLPRTKFLVCLRDPVEVVNSFGAVGGRLGQGQDYDIPFNRAMNRRLRAASGDPLVRRVLLFDYVAERLLPHLGRDRVHVVRYERWRSDPAGQMAAIGAFLGRPLSPPSVDIVEPTSPRPAPEVIAAVARHCSTAERLGYDLGRWLA